MATVKGVQDIQPVPGGVGAFLVRRQNMEVDFDVADEQADRPSADRRCLLCQTGLY